MKQHALSILAVGTMALCGAGNQLMAAPVNGSFESGSFSGWQLNISSGQSASQRGYRPAGIAKVISCWESPATAQALRSAMEGNKFALLGTQASGNFTGHRSYNISLRQELSLTAGTILSGWTFFFNGDNEAQDSAWVKILDSTGATIATPWLEQSGCETARDSHFTAYRETSAWTQWFWQAPASGDYTLSFGMTTADDNNFASYGFFDGALISSASLPVPEPSALALVMLGSAIILQQQRAKNKPRD